MTDQPIKSEGRRGRPSVFLEKLITIYRFIEAYQQDNHTSPSRRDFGPVGINSTSLSGYYLDKMEILHMIAPRIKDRARSIFLLPLEKADQTVIDYLKSIKIKKDKK